MFNFPFSFLTFFHFLLLQLLLEEGEGQVGAQGWLGPVLLWIGHPPSGCAWLLTSSWDLMV